MRSLAAVYIHLSLCALVATALISHHPNTETVVPGNTTEAVAMPGNATKAAAVAGNTTDGAAINTTKAAKEPGNTTEEATEPGNTPTAAEAPGSTPEPAAVTGNASKVVDEQGNTSEAAAVLGNTSKVVAVTVNTSEATAMPGNMPEKGAAPLPGGCNAQDVALANASKQAKSFSWTQGMCWRKSFKLFSREKVDSRTYATCLADNGLGFSATCMECFVGSMQFSAQHCMLMCLVNSCSKRCLDCNKKYSDEFNSCVGGLEFPEAAPCS